MSMKWCINCDALFVPNKKESRAQWERFVGLIDGLCKPCWGKRHYRERRDRLLELNRAWREANPDYWRQPHIQARVRQWHRDHPEASRKHIAAAKRRRRARAAGRSVLETAATEDYIAVLRADPCACCGGPADTVDHIDALSAGGDHVWTNMTSACRACNSRKHGASLLAYLLRDY